MQLAKHFKNNQKFEKIRQNSHRFNRSYSPHINESTLIYHLPTWFLKLPLLVYTHSQANSCTKSCTQKESTERNETWWVDLTFIDIQWFKFHDVRPGCDGVTQNGSRSSSVLSQAFILVETTSESVYGGTGVTAIINGLLTPLGTSTIPCRSHLACCISV